MTDAPRQNLYVFNGGFLTQGRVRRILDLAGYDIKLGAPDGDDLVGVWGQSPTAPRGEAVADRKGSSVVRVEDSFLRSVGLGRDGDSPIGLNIDRAGVHFDPNTRSDLEQILVDDPLDDTALLNRARAGIEAMRKDGISKYNRHDPAIAAPDPGYVLVIDQTRKDASIKASGCDSNSFREMLFFALTEHPAAKIIIKTHPETAAGHREGYFTKDDENERITLMDDPISPWALLDGAIAVYTVSSQLGFEAILAGHKPVVLGQPFYMGWGLTDDRKPLQRRQRNLTRAQLFAGAMILYPTWYDPFHDRLCSFEEALATLAAAARAWREDHKGWQAVEMRAWKRKPLQQFFGQHRPVRFGKVRQNDTRPIMGWGRQEPAGHVAVEDGFLRSRGLGADLIAPLSLVLDDVGIYYDAGRSSRLEDILNTCDQLTKAERDRADALTADIVAAGLSKYNLDAGPTHDLPEGRKILVPGQVEDDASIRFGTTEVTTNRDLLNATRAANPAAKIIYKPHPDVEAGLRPGALPEAAEIADLVLTDTDPIAALTAVDEVWTMTSLLGFEALLRGKRVTCLGTPFYAGWGLTDDRTMPNPRRSARLDLTGLVWGTLIAYPRYLDPMTKLPCPPEVVVDRLIHNDIPSPGKGNRLLAKLQGLMAGYAYLWRR